MANAKLEMLLTARDGASAAFNLGGERRKQVGESPRPCEPVRETIPHGHEGPRRVGCGRVARRRRDGGQVRPRLHRHLPERGEGNLGLQRVAGGTAEEMSTLRGVAKLSGMDMGQFGKSMGFVEADGQRRQRVGRDGVSAKTATGQMRPTSAVLKDVANWFNKTAPGATRTAAALAIFGKSGAAMLPFLSRGAKGIGELEEKTANMG